MLEIYKMKLSYILALILALCLAHRCVQGATNEEICEAIYKTEGSEFASKPYGILSVPCDSKESCKVICINTIRNQRVRHANHECGLSYLECLAERYAPLEAHRLNRNWLRLVKYFLNKEK